jgi:hypothetical protein
MTTGAGSGSIRLQVSRNHQYIAFISDVVIDGHSVAYRVVRSMSLIQSNQSVW